MKVKEFKEFVNNIDNKYDSLEVLDTIRENAVGMKIESYLIYGDALVFIPKVSKRIKWVDDRFYQINLTNPTKQQLEER